MYTENLDEYMKMKETDSCYLDSRYFNKVLYNYPGLITEPLKISIIERKRKSPNSTNSSKRTEDNLRIFVDMKAENVNNKFPGLMRVVIITPKSRHSNLLILDYNNGIAHRFEPLGRNAPYFEEVNGIIEEYLSFFFDFKVEVVDIDLDEYLDEKNPACLARGQKSGFCAAYILLYAYCYLNSKEYDPTHIRRFAKMVETTYGSLPREGAEIEYGFENPNAKNVVIGGGVGALAGGLLLGGVGGAVFGGLGGAAIGSVI